MKITLSTLFVVDIRNVKAGAVTPQRVLAQVQPWSVSTV
jgi:hypothetical protein